VIDEVSTRVWHFEGGRIEDFKGKALTKSTSLTPHKKAGAQQKGAQQSRRVLASKS